MQLKINCVLAVTVPTTKIKGKNLSPKSVAESVKQLLNNKVFPEIKDVDLNIRMNMDDIRSAS